MDKIKFLDNWLESLQIKEAQVTGIYEQGSTVWGFNDKNSDRDLVVIWDQDFPSKDKRQEAVAHLGGQTYDFKDIPAVQKGIDMFEAEGELLNVAHIKAKNFFQFYEGLENLGPHYREQLLRLGGFKHAQIQYDPSGRLKKYQQKIKLTPQTAEQIHVKIQKDLGADLRQLEVSLERKSTLRTVWLIDEILRALHLWYYVQKGRWPMSDKWFERFAKEHGRDDDFARLVITLSGNFNLWETGDKLLKLAKEWSFRPSKTPKA